MTVKISPEAADFAAAVTLETTTATLMTMKNEKNAIGDLSASMAASATKRPSSAPTSRDAPAASLSAILAMETFTPRASKVRSEFQ